MTDGEGNNICCICERILPDTYLEIELLPQEANELLYSPYGMTCGLDCFSILCATTLLVFKIRRSVFITSSRDPDEYIVMFDLSEFDTAHVQKQLEKNGIT